MARGWIGCGLASLALIWAAPSEALPIRVVTFTGLPGTGVPVWIENGVTVTGIGRDPQSYDGRTDEAELDPTSGLEFTTGSSFRFIDLDVDRREECPDRGDPRCSEENFFLRVSGFADGLLVPLSEPIDLLRVEAIAAPGAGNDYEVYFDIDDVTLEIVPEPSTAALFLTGLVGFAVRARIRATVLA